ncbi:MULTISPECIES: IclR family transcriptional regulator [unclassified Rhodococcus (in: high G+C Gram-positive bacteria)]|uniref:IclR family transcriptional regulator n=1 Tax=unclassified Rhodococcus (in: high G+C Gram-positive bacteria) TaxID=192944 RepID=UPI00215C6820|nr:MULTISPECIES: IclR family transcriptional regulator C-terminal domain-containing protein [unclassified Rhodococcus (in: high G+C Gram-positive bacteria)]
MSLHRARQPESLCGDGVRKRHSVECGVRRWGAWSVAADAAARSKWRVLHRRGSDKVPKPHPTVNRLVTILETIAAAPGLTVSALARHVAVPKSTVHTLVQGLLATDYLEEEAGVLSLGPGVELLASTRGGHQLRRLAHDELMALAGSTKETAHLSIKSGHNVIIIDQVESLQPIRYSVPLRVPRPLLTSASGKLFLAELDPTELEALLSSRNESEGTASVAIRNQRECIRSNGIARNLEESLTGVCTIGAAVRGAGGALLAGLIIAGPAERVRPKLDQIEPLLRDSARRLSERLQ